MTAIAQPFNYERQWATYFGGENTFVLDNSTDSEGNVYIAGYVEGSIPYSNQFTTTGSFQPSYGGGMRDGYICKFNPEGLLVWSTYFGKTGDDLISGIHIDKDDNIYITGETSSNNMASVGVHQTLLSGSSDGFIARFSVAGVCIWSTYFGGGENDAVHAIDTDFLGNLYVYGRTRSTSAIATIGSFQENWNASGDSDGNDFIASFTDGGLLIWATYYGTNLPSHSSRITGIDVNNGFFYVAGFAIDSSSSNYFATPGCYQPTNSNAIGVGADMFLSKFSLSGSREWSTYYGGGVIERSVGSGGIGDRNVHTVSATPSGVYIGGLSNSPNNVATPGSFQTTKQGYSNFVAKFNYDGNMAWGTYLGNTTAAQANGVVSSNTAMLTTTLTDEVYLSGSSYMNDIASPGSYQPHVRTEDETGFYQNNDCFIAKLSSDGTTREFGTYYGGYESEHGSRCLLHDTGFYILGTTFSTENISSENSYQPNLNVLSVTAPPVPGNAFIAKFIETPLNTDEVSKEKSAIYPIPNNGTFNVRLNSNYIGSDLAIYDAQGKMILSKIIIQENTLVKITVSDGIYIVKLSNGKDLSYNCKMVVKN